MNTNQAVDLLINKIENDLSRSLELFEPHSGMYLYVIKETLENAIKLKSCLHVLQNAQQSKIMFLQKELQTQVAYIKWLEAKVSDEVEI